MPNACALIVCERRGIWSVGLRRHLPREMRLCETRTLADCRQQLAAAPESLVLLEVTPGNVGAMLEFLAELSQRYPLARAVAVAPRDCQSYEWLLREAGAVHFTTSPRQSQTLARLAVRHAARLPAPHASFSAQIWDSLPWHDAQSR